MKIAHIVCTFPPYRGGIGGAAYAQAKGLAKLGHRVTVFTPLYSKKQDINLEGDIDIRRVPVSWKFGNAAILPKNIIKELNNFDVIHLHWPFIGTGERLFLMKYLIAPPIVMQYHMDLVGRGFKKIFFKLYNQFFLSTAVKKASRIIFSSEDYANFSLLTKHIKKEKNKISFIPFGVDIDFFKPKTLNQDLILKYQIDQKDFVILFVGGLDRAHYFKGLHNLIKAIAIIKADNLKLIVVGDGNLREDYQNLVCRLGLNNRVIFAGGCSDEMLVDFYNLANAVVLPSVDSSEAFGIVLIEAMACGKAIIVSNLPGPRSLVYENINGLLVEPNDINDLKDKIMKLYSNFQLCERLGQRGREIAEKIFNINLTNQSLSELYQKTINEKRV